MTNVRILTYATHSGGSFDSMMEDARKMDMTVEVVGWGSKWKGYFGKLKDVKAKVETFDETDIVVVIDGFDTRIRGNTDDIETLWRTKLNAAPIVFSKEPLHGMGVPSVIQKYSCYRRFGGMLNAGMYMGTVPALLRLYKDTLQHEQMCRNDDQCAFNKLVLKHGIVLDDLSWIFNNVPYSKRHVDLKELRGVFCSFPGTLSWERMKRYPVEYGPIFIPELVALSAVVYMLSTKRILGLRRSVILPSRAADAL